MANMGKNVWDLVAKKDNIWVKWIHVVYLKDDQWEIMFEKLVVASIGGKFVLQRKF